MAAGASSVEVAPTSVEEQSFVAFDHVAAGHDGVQSDASNGLFVVKPCTAAEIAFYESAAQHQALQTYMPTLFGTLTPSDQTTDALDIAALGRQTLPANPLTHNDPGHTAANGVSAPLFQHPHCSPPSLSHVSVSKRTSWQPSGGKKINTGLAIILENVAHGLKHPNILDVKLGARLWADDAPATKRQKLDDASGQTTSGSLGFRIAGMTVWQGTSTGGRPEEPDRNVEIKNGYKRYDKHYGRTFTKENVKDGFVEYFGGANADGKLKSRHCKVIIKRIARELKSIEHVLVNEESRMYSASILVVYEGDDEALENILQEEKTREIEDQAPKPEAKADSTSSDDDDDVDTDEDDGSKQLHNDISKTHDVRLIDFAHARWTPGHGPDENALQGIRNVLSILHEIAEQNVG